MNAAMSARTRKAAHPELFCANAKCLWQIVTPRGPNPCQNHPLRAVELVPGESRIASFDMPIVELVSAPRVTGCDVCSEPATAMVNAPDHRFHSFRCDLHTRDAVTAFAVINALTTVEPLRRSVQ